MGSPGLVIFDAFNTLVTSRRDSKGTFSAGLEEAGLRVSPPVLASLQAASEGLDHSAWSGSREAYAGWAASVLSELRQAAWLGKGELNRCIVPALEQLHQAPMVAMPGARACLKRLKSAGFTTAICSNWGWDLHEDLSRTGCARIRRLSCLVCSGRIPETAPAHLPAGPVPGGPYRQRRGIRRRQPAYRRARAAAFRYPVIPASPGRRDPLPCRSRSAPWPPSPGCCPANRAGGGT